RALSLVATGETVVRDMFYDGNPAPEPGAVVCRVAPSFVRFGNFEIHASRGEKELLQRLADYVITHHFPSLGAPSPSVYER
ncbi:protein adenylyltransferase SelO family protein, partial [Acinetobacter baumannii]